MTRILSLAVLAVSLGACAAADPEAACADYTDAYSACAAEAYGIDDGTHDLPSTTCDAYVDLSGAAAADSAELLSCYAAKYTEGPCTTYDELVAVTSSVTDCAAAAR